MISSAETAIIGIWDKQTGIRSMGVLPVIVCIGKRQLVLTALFCCFFAGLAAVLWHGIQPDTAPVFSAREGVPVTVVIDPGHGGEDGGAVSPGGVSESHINLAVAQRVNDLLRFAGQQTDSDEPHRGCVHPHGGRHHAGQKGFRHPQPGGFGERY